MTEQELLDEGETDPGEEGQWCSVCRELKPLCEFYGRIQRHHKKGHVYFGHRSECKPCLNKLSRERIVKRDYGMSLDEVAALHASGKCQICGETPRGPLHTDHDHVTGRVRGSLCVNCNNGLGQFKDRADLLVLAAEYLTRAVL